MAPAGPSPAWVHTACSHGSSSLQPEHGVGHLLSPKGSSPLAGGLLAQTKTSPMDRGSTCCRHRQTRPDGQPGMASAGVTRIGLGGRNRARGHSSCFLPPESGASALGPLTGGTLPPPGRAGQGRARHTPAPFRQVPVPSSPRTGSGAGWGPRCGPVPGRRLTTAALSARRRTARARAPG